MEVGAASACLGGPLAGGDPLAGPLYTRELPSLAHNICKHTISILFSIAYSIA